MLPQQPDPSASSDHVAYETGLPSSDPASTPRRSASLDPGETPPASWLDAASSMPVADRYHLSRIFRHSFWRSRREHVWTCLNHSRVPQSRLDRFRECGSNAWILQSDEEPPRYRIQTNRCHDRWCEACQVERRRLICFNLRTQLPEDRIRLLTLTLKSTAQPLRRQIDRIYDAFTKFRLRKPILACIKGGLAFLEITRNNDTRLWHPHLHVLIVGTYLPVDLARRVWHEVTGDSYIVDVRDVGDRERAASYVAKYASKAVPKTVWSDPQSLDELIGAMRSRRTFNAFGAWKHLSLSRPIDPDDIVWTEIGPLWWFIQRSNDAHDDARRILKAVRRTNPDSMTDTPEIPNAPPPYDDSLDGIPPSRWIPGLFD